MKYKILIRSIWLLILLILPSKVQSQTWKELLDKAQTYFLQQENDSANIFAKRALDSANKIYSEDDTALASIKNQVGVYYNYNRKFQQAESLWLQVLNTRQKVLGRNHPEVARILHRLGLIYSCLEKYKESESFYKQAIQVYENSLPLEDPERAKTYENLGYLYTGFDLEAAERCLLYVKHLRENALGPDHLLVGGTLLNIGNLYLEEGRYLEAEQVIRQSIDIYEKSKGSNYLALGMDLNNLATVYLHQGKLQDAEEAVRRSIYYKKKSTDQFWIYTSLITLAEIEIQEAQYDSAEIHIKRVLSYYEKSYGPENPACASICLDFAKLELKQKRHAETKNLLDRAITLLHKHFGDENIKLGECLTYLAETYKTQGLYSEAEKYYSEAIDIEKRTLGSSHPQLAQAYEFYSQFLRSKNEIKSSIETANKAIAIRKNNFDQCSIGMSERDALTYSSLLSKSADTYLSCYFDLKSQGEILADQTMSILLSVKGNVTDALLERKQLSLDSPDSLLQALTESYREAQFSLSKLYSRNIENLSPKTYKKKLDSLLSDIKQLESDMALRSSRFIEERTNQNIDLEQFRSVLPTNAQLIEFFKYNYLQPNTGISIPHYIAIVLGKSRQPVVTDIGEAEQIDKAIQSYRQHFLKFATQNHPITPGDQHVYEVLASSLYQLIWKPIASNVRGETTLFIAPDGGLNLISFAGLIGEDGKYLIEKHPIHYLSAGRDLIRMKNREKSGSGLFALGDPDYNASVSERLMNKPIASTSINTQGLNPYQVRNVRSGCTSLHEMKVMPLPGTHSEVEAISTSWHNNSPNELSTIYFGSDASEEHLKKDISGKRIIHLATHGYYINGECADKKNNKTSNDIKYAGENPLLLSGLLLAGANLHGAGADVPGAEDGILTALEVSGMDLRGTDLVVLSACETGLGKIEQGEGVYGLRRAFQLAGARTVVSSLWQVPDRETTTFMKILYSQNAKTYPELFQKAAIQRLNELRIRKQSTHPYTWAGFVATGDWRIKR